MNNLISYIQNLPIYSQALNNNNIYIQYNFNILNNNFNIILLYDNKQLQFFQINNFSEDKEINNIKIIYFENKYYFIFINNLIGLITEQRLINDFKDIKYFTFPAFETKTELAKYYASIVSRTQKNIKEQLKIFINNQ